MNIFKRITTLSRIEDQIYECEKSLIENQGTAEHYQAVADGNKITLKRLRAMRDAEIEKQKPSVPTQAQAVVSAPKPSKVETAKPRAVA